MKYNLAQKIINTSWQNPANKVIALLMIGDSLIALSTTITTPFIALYLLRTTHYGSASVGLVIGLSVLIGILFSMIGGYLSDRLGKGKIIFFSLLGSFLVYLLYYLSSLYFSKFWLLLDFTLLGAAQNAFRSIYVPVSQAFVASNIPSQNKARCFQLIFIASNLAAVVGPLLSLQLGIILTRYIFLLSALFYSFYILIILFLTKKIDFFGDKLLSRHKSFYNSFKMLIKEDKRMFYHLVSCFAVGICCAQFDNTLSQYLNTFMHDPGPFYTKVVLLNGVAIVVFQACIMITNKNLDASKMIIAGCLIFALGFYTMSLSHHSLALILMSTIIISLAQVFLFPNFCRFIDLTAPDDLKGFYFGVSFLRLLGFAIGVIIGGYGVKNNHSEILFLATAFTALMAAYLQTKSMAYPVLKCVTYE